MKFDDKYFSEHRFTSEQTNQFLLNAEKDLEISKTDKFLDVKFNYSYTAFIKAGIALLSTHRIKIKSVPGHHVKLIEKMAEILKDKSIMDMGNLMRSKRNLDLYSGGVEVTEKECKEYIKFADGVVRAIKLRLGAGL